MERKPPPRSSPAPAPGRSEFATTHWSVVVAAGDPAGPGASEALERLCRAYWYPLYTYVRRHGCSPADAEDLTQEFFARLLAREYIARADPLKGRFRAFLLSGIKRLLADERDKASRLKRGGRTRTLSLDNRDAEARYRMEPADSLTPERLFERSWVATLLDAAACRLRDEYVAAGRGNLHDELCAFRLDAEGQPAYAEAAARLGQSESAIKSAVWRMRQRHQELVREEVAQTVASGGEVDDEIRYLLQVTGS
jgi:DNA-directed RNA polymerase specialized sigma24 family protein